MDTLQVLTNKIQLLESKLDSIQTVDKINELSIKLNAQADIISNVNNFYESAWLKLLFVISLLGIIIPILIQYFQRNNLKEVTAFISKEIKETFEFRIQELKSSNEIQISQLTDKVNKELENIKKSHNEICNEVEASLFYLQGKQSLNTKEYHSAIKDFIRSTEYWLISSKPERADVLIKLIVISLGKILSKASFQEMNKKHEIDWDKFIEKIKKSPSYVNFKSSSASLKKELDRLNE